MHLFKSGDHIITGHDIYGGTYRLFTEVLPHYGITFSFIDMRDPQSVAQALRPATKGVWIETPSNPLLNLVDITKHRLFVIGITVSGCSMQKCPGQDTRFWKPEDTSEVECSKCGQLVEFFKTDGVRRCHKCGVRIVNPAVSLGCAQWCQFAKECLGFDPQSLGPEQQAQESVAEGLARSDGPG